MRSLKDQSAQTLYTALDRSTAAHGTPVRGCVIASQRGSWPSRASAYGNLELVSTRERKRPAVAMTAPATTTAASHGPPTDSAATGTIYASEISGSAHMRARG